MPKGGYFFDAIVRQEPIDEEQARSGRQPARSSACWATRTSRYYARTRRWFDAASPSAARCIAMPGTAFGDIALVPAPFLKHPKGIRDVAEWYVSTATRRDYVHAVFEQQCEIALQNIETLIDLFGDRVQVAVVTGHRLRHAARACSSRSTPTATCSSRSTSGSTT